MVRARAARGVRPWCSSSVSLICFSTLCSGLSEVIGSWKTIETPPPRTSRSTPAGAPIMSRPSTVIRPLGWLASG